MKAPVALAALLVFSACQSEAPQLTDSDRAEIEIQIRAVADQWLAELEAGNAQGTADLLDPARGDFIDGDAYYADPAEYLANARALFSDWESREGDWTRTRVDVLAPDAGVFVGDRAALVQRTDGSQWDVRTLFTFVMTSDTTGWKVLHGHVSGSWTPHRP